MRMHEEIAEHYRQLIQRGELKPKDVPGMFQMAREWRISTGTSVKARNLLMREGLAQSAPRKNRPIPQITDEVWARFLERVDPPDENGCTLWNASAPAGYGQLYIAGRQYLAHRVAYTRIVGPIPEGLELDHVYAWGCRSKRCVNVQHLEPVTRAENTQRGFAAVRWRASIWVRTELDDDPPGSVA